MTYGTFTVHEDEMAHVAQLVEHVLGKDEVTRSIRVVGSRQSCAAGAPRS